MGQLTPEKQKAIVQGCILRCAQNDKELLNSMMQQYNVVPTSEHTLSCGRTRKDCVSCKDMFGEGCGFSY